MIIIKILNYIMHDYWPSREDGPTSLIRIKKKLIWWLKIVEIIIHLMHKERKIKTQFFKLLRQINLKLVFHIYF